jgi:hypothetical protein
VTLDDVHVTARTIRTERGTTHTVYDVAGQTYHSREQLLQEHGRPDLAGRDTDRATAAP